MQHDFDNIADRLEELRARAEAMLREQEQLIQRIGEVQVQVGALKRSSPDDTGAT